jgi:exopolysaccharide production protein ExoZ
MITIIAYWYGVTDELRDGLYRVLTFGVGALTLVWSFLILEREGIYRAKGYSTLLGDASYTIYLSHLVIIWLFYFSGLRGLFTSDNIITPLIGWLVAIATILIFSTIYYIKIEKPLYKKAISL